LGNVFIWGAYSAYIERPEPGQSINVSARSNTVGFTSNIKPISYLKRNLAELVEDLTASREPLLITQNGEPKLVVTDFDSYQQNEQTLALLKLLVLGQKQIDQGDHLSVDDTFDLLEKEDRES
jgi:prevent-host-death family protein